MDFLSQIQSSFFLQDKQFQICTTTAPDIFYCDSPMPDNITCGPTSLLMVLEHYGIKTKIDDVKSKTKTEWFEWNGQKIGMTSPAHIVLAAKQYGKESDIRNGNLDEIKYYVSKNKPVIVLLRSGVTLWHYVVVIGFDNKFIYVADPSTGKEEKIIEEWFLSSWAFKTDMNGNSVCKPCSYCNGKGYIFPTVLGKCDMCGGTGIGEDPIGILVKSLEVKPFTYFLIY